MDSNKCACLALIIGRAANQNYQSVYDFGAGKLCMFTSSGSVGNIHVFDFQRDSVVTGSLTNLFEYAECSRKSHVCRMYETFSISHGQSKLA